MAIKSTRTRVLTVSVATCRRLDRSIWTARPGTWYRRLCTDTVREGRSMLIETVLETMHVETRLSSGNSDSPLENEISRNTPCTDRRRSGCGPTRSRNWTGSNSSQGTQKCTYGETLCQSVMQWPTCLYLEEINRKWHTVNGKVGPITEQENYFTSSMVHC